jgi:hypothetical protein
MIKKYTLLQILGKDDFDKDHLIEHNSGMSYKQIADIMYKKLLDKKSRLIVKND